MKHSTSSADAREMIQSQLKSSGIFWEDASFAPFKDYDVGNQTIAMFTALLGKGSLVWNAWLIVGCGCSGHYNQDDYRLPESALVEHIGRAALIGSINIIDVEPVSVREFIKNGKKKVRKKVMGNANKTRDC